MSGALPAPDSPDAPKYWMYETSGVLRPAVEAYLLGHVLTFEQVAALRVYFRQWINSPVWRGPEVELLRATVDRIWLRRDVDTWLRAAALAEVDPL
jgi:hypothetical protein